jgi:hypothetical protein
MAEQICRDELLELSELVPHLAIAESVPGLSCSVFAGGKEMDLLVGYEVARQLPGCELRTGVVISRNASFEYWFLARIGVRSFQHVKGPLTASALRSAFWTINASASGVDDSEAESSN